MRPAFVNIVAFVNHSSSLRRSSMTSPSPPIRQRRSTAQRRPRLNLNVESDDERAIPTVTGGADEVDGADKVNGDWNSFTVPDDCLRLALTLQSGQAFRWHRTSRRLEHVESRSGYAEEWVGSIGSYAYILRQGVPKPESPNINDPVWYKCINEDNKTSENDKSKESIQVLYDYFQVERDFSEMYKHFCQVDKAFETLFPYFKGMRKLRIVPEECLYSFICSSNNNLKRISSMVNNLSNTYGEKIIDYKNVTLSKFPTSEDISKNANEQDLREQGFGYRAKFITSTSQELVSELKKMKQDDGINTVEKMLLSWRNLERATVIEKLTKFPGIGRKVAGCIALMSLDQLGEIPVDTHVWKIAKRYIPELNQTKSLTPKVHEDIGNWFRDHFGENAGVAHNLLFINELSEFKEEIPKDVKNLWARQNPSSPATSPKKKAPKKKVKQSPTSSNEKTAKRRKSE